MRHRTFALYPCRSEMPLPHIAEPLDGDEVSNAPQADLADPHVLDWGEQYHRTFWAKKFSTVTDKFACEQRRQ